MWRKIARIPPHTPARTGQRFGGYTLDAFLGAGGMGEVYRAHDRRLGRDVAIKLLPANLRLDADHLARFEREARVLASLNHPHIATIYGVEDSDGALGLVLELVEGETLAQRLSGHRALPLASAVAIAADMADALDAAHERGIVHRDLKPANVKIAPGDVVKVLDFGLAKTADGDLQITTVATHAGALLGTARYMSPEQARGVTVDKRTDIWAFGCVLYEMIAGRPPFDGATLSDALVAVLEHEPDWTALPQATPVAVRRLIGRCLEKDPKRRLRDIADARLDLEAAAEEPVKPVLPPAATPPTRSSTRRWLLATAGVAAAGVAIWLAGGFARHPSPARPIAFEIDPPQGSTWGRVATDPLPVVSPDGQTIAFVGRTGAGRRMWVRAVGNTAAQELPATQDVTVPFWSSDGRKIAYCVSGRIKKIDVGGRPAEEISAACTADGDWLAAREIVFTGSDGLFRIPDAGGPAKRVTTLNAPRETVHLYPRWLPDRQHVMFVVRSTDEQVRGIYVVNSAGGTPTRVLPDESMAIPIADGRGGLHVLFVRGTTLVVQRLHPSSFAPTGEPAVVAESVALGLTIRRGAYTASPSTLVYRVDASFAPTRLVWLDRAGQQVGSVEAGSAYVAGVSMSPDETLFAFGHFNPDTRAFALWIGDRARGTTRLLAAPPYSLEPGAWSPDGSNIAVASNESGRYRPALVNLTGQISHLGTDGYVNFRSFDWSPDGRFLLGTDTDAIWMVPVSPAGPPRRIVAGRYPKLSPDGRWLAYTSSDTGSDEVYVQPFPDGAKTRVSTAGGFDAKWRGDGRELFYLSAAGDLNALRIRTAPTLETGAPEVLFKSQMRAEVDSTYAVTKDGRRFLVNLPSTTPPPLTAVINWLDGRSAAR